MRATISVTPDVNILALHRMLAENGLWLVRVHNRHIVRVSHVPPEMSIDELLAVGEKTGENTPAPFLSEDDSQNG